jgi:polysaccharide biosynthesis transport protein
VPNILYANKCMPESADTNIPDTREDENEQSTIIARLPAAIWQRRWWVLATTLVVAFGAIIISLYLPDRFTSEATIFVVQQRIPERYVVSTNAANLSDALDSMVQEILSRPRLLAIVDEFGLYAEERKHLQADRIADLARRDVLIEPLSSRTNAFQISFTAKRAELAHAVTTKLTKLFIEENLKTRADQASTTTSFLREQLQVANAKLLEQEARLRDFKMQYLGELPEQQQGNVGILVGMQTQLDNVMAAQNQAEQQKLYLESLLSERQRLSRAAAVTGMPISGQTASPLEAAQRESLQLEAEYKQLLKLYTAQYPDVRKKAIELETQRETVALLKARGASSGEHGAEAPVDVQTDINIAQLKSQLQANALQIGSLKKTEENLRGEIDKYRARINMTPVREQQLTSMQRDYDTTKQNYTDLLKKEQESQLATNLELRQEGQQFRLADPPSMPSRPSSPKRLKISLIALLGGLLLGCTFAFLAELKSATYHSVRDITNQYGFNLVIGIPLYLTPAQIRAQKWKSVFESVAASMLVAAVGVAEYFVYLHG